MKTQVETLDTMISEEDLDYSESYIEMKCIRCGYEEEMPTWVYGEEADFLSDIGDPSPPCWQCPKCHKDTLYRKGIKL